jgi:hypothetical protein
MESNHLFIFISFVFGWALSSGLLLHKKISLFMVLVNSGVYRCSMFFRIDFKGVYGLPLQFGFLRHCIGSGDNTQPHHVLYKTKMFIP